MLLDAIISQRADDVEARALLAQAYAATHDYSAAEQQYRTALSAHPDDDLRLGLAEVFVLEQRYAQAQPLYRAVLADRPGDAEELP